MSAVVQSDTQRGFADRLGGRWAISRRGFVVAFGITLVGVVADVQRLGSPDGLVVLAVPVVVFAFNGLVDVILHVTRWSKRRDVPVPAYEVLARLMFSGLTFAVAFAILRVRLDIDTPMGVTQGFFLYPVFSTWLGSSIVVYLDVIDQARDVRRRAVTDRARSAEIVRRAEHVVAALRERVNQEIEPEIDRLRDVTGTADRDTVPHEIRSMVDRSVRTVGCELWRSADGQASRIRFTEVLRSVLVSPVFRPWPMIGLGILAPMIEAPDVLSVPVLLLAVAATVVVLGECWVANTTMARWPRLRPLVVVAVVAVFSTQTMLVDRLGEAWGQPADDPGVLTVVMLTVSLLLVTSALGSYRDLNDERALVIAEQIAFDRLDAEANALLVSDETRRLAALLHGRLQSRLLGCAMAIEFAKDEPAALSEALERTTSVLAERWDADEPESRPSVSTAVEIWRGLTEVNLDVPPDSDEWMTGDVVVVVEELVANAVRHGRAGRVDVSIRREGGDCVVVVTDDGSSDTSQRPGLGSMILERAGQVSRSTTPTGWTVTVTIPVQ